MAKNKSLTSIKNVTIYTAVVVVFSLVIFAFVINLPNWIYSTTEVISSNITAVLTGLITGVVTIFASYLVASYQVRAAQNKDQIEMINKTKNYLRLIKNELEENKTICQALNKADENDYKKVIVTLSDYFWRNAIFQIDINDELFERLCITYHNIKVQMVAEYGDISEASTSTVIKDIEKSIVEIDKYVSAIES